MHTIEEIKALLRNHNLRAVARAAGIHENGLYRIMSGATRSPRYDTVMKLARYIDAERAMYSNSGDAGSQ